MENVSFKKESAPLLSAENNSLDYTFVPTIARIAFYDDFLSAPRITEIPPAETAVFIEDLTTKIYDQAKNAGGSIPYTIIKEVAENYIHARFKEIVVSIFDKGNTIRFSDQGPGIKDKNKAQLPGYSSATEPMKRFIRGVGSGLPLVKEYLSVTQGKINIEDNIDSGAVITISIKDSENKSDFKHDGYHQRLPLHKKENLFKDMQYIDQYSFYQGINNSLYRDYADQFIQKSLAPLTHRERDVLSLISQEGSLGITEISKTTNIALSSTYVVCKKLEEAGLIEKGVSKKRQLTPLGRDVAQIL